MKLSELAKDLKPYLLPWVSEAARVTVQQSGLVAHDLAGPYHDGDLDRTQAPWVAADISSALATHVAAPDPHPAYVLASGDTMTGPLLLPSGSLSAPSWAFSASPTTGVYRQAADSLSIVTAGAERLRFNATGQAALNGTPLTGYAMTHRPATGQTGGFTLEGTYDSAGFLFNTSAIVRHAAQTTAQVFRWVPTAEPQGALTNLLNLNNNLRLDNSSSNISNLRLNQGQLLGQAGYTGTISNLSVFHALNASLGGATVTNQYGYYCAPLSGATLSYAFYAAGTTPSYFGGTIYANTDIEVSGEVLVDAGTSGAPSVAGLIDTNTGVNLPGGDIVALVAGGTVAVNVGPTGAAVGTAFDTTAALKVQSAANDDITLFLKQKSGQTARMWRVEDSTGQEIIVLDSQGNLQSGNPGFVSGLTGWQMTPQGNLEANNAFIRGALHASIFTMNEFHASGGTLYIAPAGKLELDATVNVSVGIEAVFDIRTTSALGSGSQFDIRTTSALGSGSQFTLRTIENYFAITDPPSGHAMILSARDIVRCKALGLGVGIDLWDVWGVVTRVEDMTDYYRYYYTLKSGGTNGLIIPAGTAIISYGKPGDGRIYLTADQNYAPYMQVFLSGEEPWNGQITPTVRIGRLDGVGLPGVSGIEQHGIVLSSNLSNASAPYLVASNLQMFSYKIDSEWNNGNPTARITANGEFRLGTDVDADNTTGLKFNPATGALDIGNASYPGAVNVRGVITVTGGSGYGNFSDRPTSLSGINAGEGTKLNAGLDSGGNLITKVLPGATIGTPGGAGLFLGADKMGYYSGSAWTMYFDNTGKMGLGGTAGARLAWDGTDLLGTDGTNVQWYARASTGKLYAGNGAVIIDRTGIGIANDNVSSGLSLYRTATFANSSKAGRLWALSDLSPMRVYLTAGRSVADGGDATSAAGFLDLAAYNSGGVVTAMLSLAGSTGVTTVTGDVSINGDLEASNVLSIRTTAP
jgi:hypothetical protein